MFGIKRSDAHLVNQVLRGRKDYYAPLVERYLPAVRFFERSPSGDAALPLHTSGTFQGFGI